MRYVRFGIVPVLILMGCVSSSVGRTRALIDEGNLDGAVDAAGTSWTALREVSMAIATSAVEQNDTRVDAIGALEAAGEQAEPTLSRLVASEDPLTSALSAAALLRMGLGDRGLLEALLRERLGAADPQTRAVAVRAIGARVEQETFFRTHLADSEEQIRLAVIQAMSEHSNIDGAEALLSRVAEHDVSVSVRAKSLRVLSKIDGGEETIRLAALGLRHESVVLRLAAVDALSRADDRQRAEEILSEELDADNEALRARAVVVLAGWNVSAARQILRAMMTDGEPGIAVMAAIGAGQIGDDMVETLRSGLNRDEGEVRLYAAAGLIGTSDRDIAMTELTRLLEEPGWIGLHAALLVARGDDDAALARISQALSDPDERLRSYAVSSCSTLPRGLELARQNLSDRAPRVRLAAAATILKIMARRG